MSIVFPILWSLAVARVLFSPLLTLLKPIFRLFLLTCIIWAAVGLFFFGTQYIAYQKDLKTTMEQIAQLQQQEALLETVTLRHPNAKPILLGLTEIKYRLHDKLSMDTLIGKLRRIDPNDPQIEVYR